jgi:Cytochrome c554 and c-prime
MMALVLAVSCRAGGQGPPVEGISMTTADRLEEPGWWPTKGDAQRSQYSGSEACARCHQGVARHQESTPMYHASMRAAGSYIAANPSSFRFKEDTFRTSVKTSREETVFTVTDGVSSESLPITWAFGFKNGQTYILERDGAYFESRLSFFTKTNALDITPGHSSEVPKDLQHALGLKMDIDRARGCFQCHTTAAVTSNVFESEKAIPGVTCEACHGPGAAHVASMAGNNLTRGAAEIMDPTGLSPSASVDFCGACHTTWADVVATGGRPGLGNIRFQPYGLEQSRCWGTKGDARITCVACHDPHRPLVQEPSAYDSKCLACHGVRKGAKKPMSAKNVCKVAASNCVTCHMPKYELPQTHAVFTDHEIRVVPQKVLDSGELTR